MKIKQLINSFIVTGLFFGVQTVSFASPATDSSIDKLMQLSNITAVFEQTNKDMQPYFDAQAEELVHRLTGAKSLNIEQQNAVLQISAMYSELQQSITKDPKFIQMFKGLFQRTFTEEEVQANIAFLSTPLGQSINKKMSILMTDLMLETEKFSQEQMLQPERQKLMKQKMEKILTPLMQHPQ